MTKSKPKTFLSMLLALMLVFTALPMSAFAAEVDVHDHEHEATTIIETVADELSHAAEGGAGIALLLEDDETPSPETPETPDPAEVAETVVEESDPYSGNIGDSSVSWRFDTSSGRLVFTGSGDCEEFQSADDQPWRDFRDEIIEVWFYDMDSLSITNLAYWFDGCSALTMAEIPYTTSVIGQRAFADCDNLKTILIYHDGGFTIKDSAFETDELKALEIRYIAFSEATASILNSYEWTNDNRAVYFEDVYGLSLLASGYCIYCKTTSSYTLDYEYWTTNIHSIRHWCSNCGLDQCEGAMAENHTFSNGVCSKCGYDNGTGSSGGGGTTTCYHYNSYYSWSGCDYYEYCSNCGEYLGSGTSHGSTYTSWSGCDWYEYCRDCGDLMDYGTSHGTYSYGSWEYYSSTRHRRYYSCNDCGEGSYSYGSHSTTTKYSSYSSTQHQYGSYCSTCSSYVGSTSYANHSFSYGSWTKYNASQHRRTVSCSTCGYSSYEYASHSMSTGSWTSSNSTQHTRTSTCSCGYSTTETASHTLTYGSWTKYSSTQHKRTVSCSGCSYSTTEYANHSLTTGSWTSSSDTSHSRTTTCSCGYSTTETVAHSFTYGKWTEYDNSQHRRTATCSCGYSGYDYASHELTSGAGIKQKDDAQHYLIHTCECGLEVEEAQNHSFTYSDWSPSSDAMHIRDAACRCGFETEEAGYHYDDDFDGYCDDCSYLLTFFSVTVPANMSLTVSNDGEVYAATNAAVINNSSHAVEITAVTITAGDNWTLVPYDYNMADEKVNSRLIGFYLNGAETRKIGATESLVLPDNWTIDRDDSFNLQYDAVVSATSDILQNEQVLTLVFIMNWAPR